MQSYRLTGDDYQKLIDRGWRRSGKHLYNPINRNTCCPNYPLSCDASRFKFTRSQRKCIENLNSFLLYNDSSVRTKFDYTKGLDSSGTTKQIRMKTHKQLLESSKARDRRFLNSCERKAKLYNWSVDEAIEHISDKWLRRRPVMPTLERYLYPDKSLLNNDGTRFKPKHKLVIKMNHVESRQSENLRKDEHAILLKYQRVVHKESSREWTMPRYCGFLVNTPIITEKLLGYDYITDSDDENDSHDTCSKKVNDNPMGYLLVEPPELPTAFGTYHCTYHLDNRLIAVGVLDVLPKCITTVYFFYDPKYAHLNLGIYSALVEISMVRQVSKHFIGPPDQNKLIHYYMGYYVHECKKMHYKTRFRPSYLLCSETNRYVDIDICLNKLKGTKYARFHDGPHVDETDDYDRLMNNVLLVPVSTPVTAGRRLIPYLQWIEARWGHIYVNIIVNNFLVRYVRVIGFSLAPRLCLQLHVVHRSISEKYTREMLVKMVPYPRRTTRRSG